MATIEDILKKMAEVSRQLDERKNPEEPIVGKPAEPISENGTNEARKRSFDEFLDGIKDQARDAGMSAGVLAFEANDTRLLGVFGRHSDVKVLIYQLFEAYILEKIIDRNIKGAVESAIVKILARQAGTETKRD